MDRKLLYILDGGVFLLNKAGFFLHEAMIVIVLCSVVILNLVVFMNVQMKREELMQSIEQQINLSWEEIFNSFQECNACQIEKETEQDPS